MSMDQQHGQADEALDEAAIQAVMEDVGLKDLICHDEAQHSSPPAQDSHTPSSGDKDNSQEEEEEPEGKLVIDQESTPDESAGAVEGNTPGVKMECEDAPASSGACEDEGGGLSSGGQGKDGGLEAKLGGDRHEEDEHTKLEQLTIPSSAVRRSSRTPKQPNETTSPTGRTTRSQINPDILAKQKSFMHKYQIAVKSSMDSYVRSAAAEPEVVKAEQPVLKRKWEDSGGGSESVAISPVVVEKKAKRSLNPPPTSSSTTPIPPSKAVEAANKGSKVVDRHDAFCWACHSDTAPVVKCRQCPRVFHQRCVQLQSPIPAKWLCTECSAVRNAEKQTLRDSPELEQLCNMLRYALDRIKSVADAQPFFKPVDIVAFPHYPEYVVCPVDIGLMEEKVDEKAYLSTRSFLAEFRWILHNCIIFNSPHSKLTSTARTLMKVAKHEMAEIDTCADCYIHAHTKRETWFLEPCGKPHLLLWAKLKGFPHWPAKAMKSTKEGSVDVRFFGAHDRAWVPAKDCYLYSKEPPMALKNQRKASMQASIDEVDQHIKKLVEQFGSFAYPAPRTAYNPLKEDEQLRMLLPGYKGSEDSQDKSVLDTADCDSLQSDLEDAESTGGDPQSNDASLPAADDPPPAPVAAAVETGPEEVQDRTEDRNFMAMLQLAPRSSIESSPSTESKSTPACKTRSVRSGRSSRVPSDDSTNIQTDANHRNGDALKPKRTYLATPNQRTPTAKEAVKAEAAQSAAVEESQPEADAESSKEDRPIAISIDKVVGNYKPSNTTPSKPSGPKSSTPAGAKTAPAPAMKASNNSKQAGKGTNHHHGHSNKPPTFKTNSKVTLSRSHPAKPHQQPATAATKPAGGGGSSKSNNNKRPASGAEEDLDPAMYLDPTITITLVNSDGEKRSGGGGAKCGTPEISSSDLQALSALGENVSITVVPKKKAAPSGGSAGNLRSKENEAVQHQQHQPQQPMVIEVDPVALQKARAMAAAATAPSAKARKTFPSNRPSRPSVPGQQQHQKGPGGGGSHRNGVPPMVSIPSRQLSSGSAEVARLQQSSSSTTTARVPSITVRPVSHPAPAQPSIILQPGATSSSAAAIPADATTVLPVSVQQAGGTANGALTLNTMTTLGPDSGFGTGGLLLTFNRPVPTLTSGAATAPGAPAIPSSSGKADSGPINAHLAARTQQIADMVRATLDTLLQEMSTAGSLEAKVVQLQMDLERCRSQQEADKEEAKRALESERAAAEAEKARALEELKTQLEADKQAAVDEVKKKQWCAHCAQEAIFYCCWNTAYCDYPCQQAHWPKHMATCANANQYSEDGEAAGGGGGEAETEADPVEPANSGPKIPSPCKSSAPMLNGSPMTKESPREAMDVTMEEPPSSDVKLHNNNNEGDRTSSPVMPAYAVAASPNISASSLTDSPGSAAVTTTTTTSSLKPRQVDFHH